MSLGRGSIKERTWAWFRAGNEGTTEACARAIGLPAHMVAARVSELRDSGSLIAASRAMNELGRSVKVWRATEVDTTAESFQRELRDVLLKYEALGLDAIVNELELILMDLHDRESVVATEPDRGYMR